MRKELVSIIIPAYNCEKYIEACLNSVFNQTYENIEVVVVDDGSTDRTLDICMDLKNKYPEMILKTQDNKGVSSARNAGMESSKGEYVCFVDADDYIPSNYIYDLIQNKDENDDLVCCKYKMIEKDDGEKGDSKSTEVKRISKNDLLSELLLGSKILGTPWAKLFKRSIINENNIFFDEGLKVCEDLFFCIQYAIKTDNNAYITKPAYYYRKNDGSFNAKMQKQWDDIYLQRISVCERIEKIVNDSDSPSSVKRCLKYQIYFSNARVYEYVCASTLKKQKLKLKKSIRRVIRKYNYLYVWYMFKTKNFNREHLIYFSKNILRGFGYSS